MDQFCSRSCPILQKRFGRVGHWETCDFIPWGATVCWLWNDTNIVRKMCVKVGFLFRCCPFFFYNIITPPVPVLLLLWAADHMLKVENKCSLHPPPKKQDMKSNSVANDFILGLECRKYGYKTSSFFLFMWRQYRAGSIKRQCMAIALCLDNSCISFDHCELHDMMQTTWFCY